MGIVIDGRNEALPGMAPDRVQSYVDDPRLTLALPNGGRPRRHGRVQAIVLHTTKGLARQSVRDGLGTSSDAGRRVVKMWAGSGRKVGAHLMVDFDGVVSCLADLQRTATYHAGEANELTIGIEIMQGAANEGGHLYAGQLDVVVRLVDFLTRRFGIQRQVPGAYRERPTARLKTAGDFYGIFGHRDQTSQRGRGCPGDHVFTALMSAGYESFVVSEDDDKRTWRARQERLRQLGHSLVPDGIPGPATRRALLAEGRAHGLWVARPDDDASRAAAI